MNRDSIVFPHETGDNFLRRCMNNEFSTDQAIVDACAEASRSVEEFVDLYLSHQEERSKQFYQELMRRERPALCWKFIREEFGERCFKTESDAGSVKVGNKQFSVLIPNGEGDGVTRVAVFAKESDFICNSIMDFFTIIDGEFNIFAYDCGNAVSRTLQGRYSVYVWQGFVAFVALREND